jgi:glycosyltransferase involved in cell wall biosynthesis
VGHLKRFPDAHVGWLPFAFAAGRRERFDAMWSSSGPFTSHLVGWLLKRLIGTPWLVELRDGWYRWNRAIFPDYPWWRDALERRLEAMVIRSADRVILVTDRMRDAFRRQYPDIAAARFAVIPNGFDPDQFAPGLASAKTAGRWEVCHTGALYYGRSLAAFLQAVRQLIAAEPAFSREFRLTLVGTLDATARAELASAGLDTHISWIGQQDHASTIGQMRRADALLLIANTTQGAEATVPGKLFEYLAVGGPIVAIAPRISATADVLAQTGGAWLAEPDDPASIASALRRAYRDRVAPRDEAAVRRFDRRGLTRELACILDEVVERATRRL